MNPACGDTRRYSFETSYNEGVWSPSFSIMAGLCPGQDWQILHCFPAKYVNLTCSNGVFQYFDERIGEPGSFGTLEYVNSTGGSSVSSILNITLPGAGITLTDCGGNSPHDSSKPIRP
jgi:hypothetical protein